MPYIGDDYLTTREYQALRERYKAARTTKPWKQWARHELSPAGARDRAVVERTRKYEKTAKERFHEGEKAQRQAMDQEYDPIGEQEEYIREMDWRYAQ